MDISDLSGFDPEGMAIGHGLLADGTIEPGESQEDVHSPHFLINDIPPFRYHDPGRHAQVACVTAREPAVRVSTALQPGARRTPGYSDVLVGEAVEIRIPCGSDNVTTVMLLRRDGIPLFQRVPISVSRRVERPVPRICDDGLDGGDLVVGKDHTGTNHVGVFYVGDDELRKSCAKSRVVDTTVVVDDQGLRQNSRSNGYGSLILGIGNVSGK